MKQTLIKNKLQITFFIVFTLLFFANGYNNIVSEGPSSIHAWRQSDSYSFALTYFYENNKLLEPSMLFIGEDGHGKAVSELPILYFITAKIWQFTGVTPAVLKFINFLICIVGLFHLMLLSKKILYDNFWAMFVVLLLFSSPLLGYYSFNFIPNIPAFGLALTGLYYLYQFGTTNKNKYFLGYTLIFSIASLIKVTSLFSLFGGLFVLSTYYLGNYKKHRFNLLKAGISLSFILAIYFLWYNYSVEYNRVNLEGMFNQSILPIWELDFDSISNIASKFNHYIFSQFFNVPTAYILLLAIITIIVFPRKINIYARRATYVYFLGTIAFMAIFYQGLNVHDYFLINTLVIIPTVGITLLLTIKEIYPQFYQSKYFKISGVLVLIFLLNYNMIVTRSHYNPHCMLVKHNLPLQKRQKDKWDYNFWIMELRDFKYQGINKYLREIGIQYDNKVITLDDHAPNKTLSLMHQLGFSEYHYANDYEGKAMIERMIELGAEYLIICGDERLKDGNLSEYTKNIVGEHNGIKIFKIATP